ncbi:MAG: hypothetical protein ACKVXR_04750 [Planctomycetota bacterium]
MKALRARAYLQSLFGKQAAGMSDTFELFDEPALDFKDGQRAEDPRDGLALFGALGSSGPENSTIPPHVVIGTAKGILLWRQWTDALNSPAACKDPARHRPWPPFTGYEVAFGGSWPQPHRTYALDAGDLDLAARRTNRFERAYSVAGMYLASIEAIKKLDAPPAVVVCVVPDLIYDNCRPTSYVAAPSDRAPEPALVKAARAQIREGQSSFFGQEGFTDTVLTAPEQFDLSPDFRRQLKARMMTHGIPVQILREDTLRITPQVRDGLRGTNPLSDRLWNLGTALYYKSGRKPWKLSAARDGVCYVGLAYRRSDDGRTACCAAQMFLDSGDGIVFLGGFGPWYSEERKEYHLTPRAAEELLRGTIATYREQDGRPLKEIFLHSRSGIDREEFDGFQRACPPGCTLIGVRVRQDRGGARLFRNGTRPVLRGTFWHRTPRYGLLFSNGFKPRIGTYDGFEIPVPLEITVQHGSADLSCVARDILGLTKLNFNACQPGEGLPITIKFSDAIGEILLANPALPRNTYRHNFKFYI